MIGLLNVDLSIRIKGNSKRISGSLSLGAASQTLLKPGFMGLIEVSGKLPTYPSPKPTLTLTSCLGQNVDSGEG